MSNNTSSSSSSGIGFVGLLTIAFIVLKLLDKITWSWWWVLSPMWISTGAFVAVFVLCGAIYVTVKQIKRRKARNLLYGSRLRSIKDRNRAA